MDSTHSTESPRPDKSFLRWAREDFFGRIPVVVVFSAGVFGAVALLLIVNAWKEPELVTVLSDAFKVGLGAMIGVLAQWANKVFGEKQPADHV